MVAYSQSESFLDLSSWVDSLQSQGRYFFTSEQAMKQVNVTRVSFINTSLRLARKNRIVRLFRGFYIIVPLEYAAAGVLPAEWFVADLMSYIGKPYYVGLLSAATLHGAAHQQPQEFQVVTTSPLRKIEVRNLSLHFFTKKNFASTRVIQIKVQTGFVSVSTPESTAFDLVRYARQLGGLDQVFTVLQELGEVLDGKKLAEVAAKAGNLTHAQRLGWLLEKAGFEEKVGTLAQWVAEKCPLPAKLEPSSPIRGALENKRWTLLINTRIEGDL